MTLRPRAPTALTELVAPRRSGLDHPPFGGGQIGTAIQAGTIHGDVILNGGGLDERVTFRSFLQSAHAREGNDLREVGLFAPDLVVKAAEDLYAAVRDSADTQFELHQRHYGSDKRLADPDGAAFGLHTRCVEEALDAFVKAVRSASARRRQEVKERCRRCSPGELRGCWSRTMVKRRWS